jgi:hypothetical protein
MRYLCLSVAVLVIFTGANCLSGPLLNWLDPGGGDDGPGDSSPARCHSGTFQCADGPILTECGTWYFDINGGDAVVGAGEITGTLPSAPVQVILSGIVDPDGLAVHITLTSSNDGNGEMNLTYQGPTLTLTGDWQFIDGPEPAGVEVGGELTGESCTSLW